MSLLSTREKSYKGLARTKSVTEKIASTELPCRKASQSNSARVYSVVLSLNDCCTTKGEENRGVDEGSLVMYDYEDRRKNTNLQTDHTHTQTHRDFHT